MLIYQFLQLFSGTVVYKKLNEAVFGWWIYTDK